MAEHHTLNLTVYDVLVLFIDRMVTNCLAGCGVCNYRMKPCGCILIILPEPQIKCKRFYKNFQSNRIDAILAENYNR